MPVEGALLGCSHHQLAPHSVPFLEEWVTGAPSTVQAMAGFQAAGGLAAASAQWAPAVAVTGRDVPTLACSKLVGVVKGKFNACKEGRAAFGSLV